MSDRQETILYKAVSDVIRFFSPKFRIEGEENLPAGPTIIVGNHSHMYGPIAAELYTPGEHYTWCAGEMMDIKEVPEYAYRDFWSYKPKAVRWFYKILSYLIAPISKGFFKRAHTIPVYHDSRVMNTFRQTITYLKNGSRVVIFPEHRVHHNNIICEFQDRFIDVARLYYRKTGESISFVPMYLCPKMKKIVYGKPIVYSADVPIVEERKRICSELMESITDMAVSMPVHTVVPYENVSRRHYPKSIPLEVY